MVKPSIDYLKTSILQPAPTNMGFSELFSSGVCGNAFCSMIPLTYVFREQIDTLNIAGENPRNRLAGRYFRYIRCNRLECAGMFMLALHAIVDS